MTVLGWGLASAGLDLGAGQEQEVAVVAVARPVAEHRGPERPLGQGVDQPEVVRRDDVALFERDARLVVADRGRSGRRRWGCRST